MAEDGEDDDEWRFSVDEVGPDSEEEQSGAARDVEAEDRSEDDDDEWGVTIGEDDDAPTVTVGGPGQASDDGADSSDGEGGNVAGTVAPDTPVEPGTPNLENVVFTTAGAVLAVLVFVSLVVSDPVILAGVGIAIVLASAALYAFFTRF